VKSQALCHSLHPERLRPRGRSGRGEPPRPTFSGNPTFSVCGHFFGQTPSSDPTTGLKNFQETGPASRNFRNLVVGSRAISAHSANAMKIKLIVLSQNLGVMPNMVYFAPNCRWVINFLEDSPIEPLTH
jgi:hypothetical protein